MKRHERWCSKNNSVFVQSHQSLADNATPPPQVTWQVSCWPHDRLSVNTELLLFARLLLHHYVIIASVYLKENCVVDHKRNLHNTVKKMCKPQKLQINAEWWCMKRLHRSIQTHSWHALSVFCWLNSTMDTMYKRKIRRSHMAGGLPLWFHSRVKLRLLAR